MVVYDGHCNLCIGSVRFLQRRVRPGAVTFLANPAADQRTVVVIDGDREYRKSDGSLHLLRYMRFPWPALGILRLIPQPVRDTVYDWVARNRYRWFGRREELCQVPATSAARSASASAG